MNDKDKYQAHNACSFAYKIVSEYKEYTKELKLYRGTNAINTFLEAMIEEEKEILEILKTNKDMIITDDEEKEFHKTLVLTADLLQ